MRRKTSLSQSHGQRLPQTRFASSPIDQLCMAGCQGVFGQRFPRCVGGRTVSSPPWSPMLTIHPPPPPNPISGLAGVTRRPDDRTERERAQVTGLIREAVSVSGDWVREAGGK